MRRQLRSYPIKFLSLSLSRRSYETVLYCVIICSKVYLKAATQNERESDCKMKAKVPRPRIPARSPELLVPARCLSQSVPPLWTCSVGRSISCSVVTTTD